MVAIQGEAGLGKSTRLAATEEPSGDGWSTVKSAGSAIEADLPFAYAQQPGGSLRPTDPVTSAASDPLGRRALASDLTRLHLQEWTRSGGLLGPRFASNTDRNIGMRSDAKAGHSQDRSMSPSARARVTASARL